MSSSRITVLPHSSEGKLRCGEVKHLAEPGPGREGRGLTPACRGRTLLLRLAGERQSSEQLPAPPSAHPAHPAYAHLVDVILSAPSHAPPSLASFPPGCRKMDPLSSESQHLLCAHLSTHLLIPSRHFQPGPVPLRPPETHSTLLSFCPNGGRGQI